MKHYKKHNIECIDLILERLQRCQRKFPIMSGRNFGINIRLGKYVFQCFFRTYQHNTHARCNKYDYLFYPDDLRKITPWMFIYNGKQLNMVQIGRRIKTTRTINWDGFIPLDLSLFDYKKCQRLSNGWTTPAYTSTRPNVTYF